MSDVEMKIVIATFCKIMILYPFMNHLESSEIYRNADVVFYSRNFTTNTTIITQYIHNIVIVKSSKNTVDVKKKLNDLNQIISKIKVRKSSKKLR